MTSRPPALNADLEEPITAIQDLAIEQGLTDVLVPSTDAFITALCYAGALSLSHMLSYIERYKDRILAIGSQSEVARRQIVASVMEYWAEKPGVGVLIIDKLLNYTILTPMSVLEWVFTDQIDRGKILTYAHIYEIVASTLHKVTNRVRQLVRARDGQVDLPADQKALLDEALTRERVEMKKLFESVEDALRGVADGSADTMVESADADSESFALLRVWGGRWLRVFRRKGAVEESWVLEMLEGKGEIAGKVLNGNGNEDGVGLGDAMDDEVL